MYQHSNQKTVYNRTTDRAPITTPVQSAAITFDDGDGFLGHGQLHMLSVTISEILYQLLPMRVIHLHVTFVSTDLGGQCVAKRATARIWGKGGATEIRGIR